MIKEINPTKEYLKAITGKFDLETIFVLNLEEKNISKLNGIILCVNLTILNLSSNKLNSVSGISSLKELKYLDLSYNMITNLDDLEYLNNLRLLKLQGNKIEMPKNFNQKFINHIHLEKLSFQQFDMNKKSQNPICKIDNYRNEMFNVFTNLKILDFIKKDSETLIECFKDKHKKNNLLEIKEINVSEYNFDFKQSK